jgi:hypothetical protein
VRVLEEQVAAHIRDPIVEDEAIDRLLAQRSLGGLARRGDVDDVAIAHQQRGECQPDRRFIVDEQDAQAAPAARLIRVRQHGGGW